MAERIPILPHELRALNKSIEQLKTEQLEKGLSYGEAVDNSGGDWAFDDPASISAAHELNMVDQRLKKLKGILNQSVEVGYPNKTDIKVNVGSRITIEINGQQQLIDVSSVHLPSDKDNSITKISTDSPIGKHLIGMKLGETKTIKLPNRKTVEIKIIYIDQTAQCIQYNNDN